MTSPGELLVMLTITAGVVIALLVVVIRLDLQGRLRRRRFERRVRRGAASLVREAERVRRGSS